MTDGYLLIPNTGNGYGRILDDPAFDFNDGLLDNQIINNFESSLNNWLTGSANLTLALDNVVFNSGTQSARVTRINTAGTQQLFSNAQTTTPKDPVVPGQQVTLSAMVRQNRAAGTATIRIDARFNLGTGGLVTLTGPNVSVPANTWTLVSGTFTAPANIDSTTIVIVSNDTWQIGENMWVDDSIGVNNTLADGIDIRVEATIADWDFAGFRTLLSKTSNTTNGFGLQQGFSGLRMFWGSGSSNFVSSGAHGITDNTRTWVRAVLEAAAGPASRERHISFYKSTDAVTWTQIGSTTVQSGPTVIANNANEFRVGMREGTTEPIPGRIYQVQIRRGMNGTPMVDTDFRNYEGNGQEFVDNVGRTWNNVAPAIIVPKSPTDKPYLQTIPTAGFAVTPHTTAMNAPTDLDVRVYCSFDTWPAPILQTLMARWDDSTSNRSWILRTSGSGNQFQFFWSSTGADNPSFVTSVLELEPESAVWVRVTLDIDNGAEAGTKTCRFYLSGDGDTWTLLSEQTTSTTGTLPIFASTSHLVMGRQNILQTDDSSLIKFYYGEVRSGINGAIVAAPDPWNHTADDTIFIDPVGLTWLISPPAHIVVPSGEELYYIQQPAPLNRETEYSFLVTDMLSGTILDEVELSSMNWDELYDRPGAGRATARIDDPTTTQINFKSWSNGLWVVKDGDIRWGGFMGAIQPQASTRVINIPLFGWEEYLRHQLVTDNRGMGSATFNTTERIVRWAQAEQLAIVEDLVNHSQSNVIGNQNIGLSTIVNSIPAGGGVLRDLQIPQWEGKYAGEVLEEMADNIDGFDWFQEFYWEGSKPKCRLRLVYPREARQTNFVLEYDNDGGNTNILSYDFDGGVRPVTRLLGQGEGDGANMLMSYNWEVLPGQVNYDGVSAHKTIKELNTLEARLEEEKRFKRVIKPQLQAKLDPQAEPGYTEYRCSDTMRVIIRDGYIDVDKEYKVIGKSIVLSKQHDEAVEVTMFDMTAGDELEDIGEGPL